MCRKDNGHAWTEWPECIPDTRQCQTPNFPFALCSCPTEMLGLYSRARPSSLFLCLASSLSVMMSCCQPLVYRENPTRSDFESAKWLMELIVPSALVAAWKQKRGVDTIGQRTFSSSDNNSAATFAFAETCCQQCALTGVLLTFVIYFSFWTSVQPSPTLFLASLLVKCIRAYRNPVTNKANPEK